MSQEANMWVSLLDLVSGFAESGVDVVLANEVYHPNASQPYIYVNPVWLAVDDQVISFDCGSEYRGYLNCAIRVPVAWTYANHLGLANRFAAAIPQGSRASYDGVNVQIYSAPKLFMSSYLDGPLNRIDMQIPFRSWA